MLAGHFGRDTGGGLCRGPHRASGTLRALPIVLIEEQRREHLAHVTLHIVAEHAQEHMRAIGLVVEWPDVQVDAFEAAKGAVLLQPGACRRALLARSASGSPA